jgi:hypothetical protein
MTSSPRVSVVIEVYNCGPFLDQTIAWQEFEDWELTLVDDGSTGETPHIPNAGSGPMGSCEGFVNRMPVVPLQRKTGNRGRLGDKALSLLSGVLLRGYVAAATGGDFETRANG